MAVIEESVVAESEGEVVLNLGCGSKTSDRCVNIDWSILIRLRSSHLGTFAARRMLSGDRLARFESLSTGLLVHDLRKGIPFPRESVDAAYHSHLLEHIERRFVPSFLAEIWRVLKPGAIHRIAVPDWEELCRDYLSSLARAEVDRAEGPRHEETIAAMIDQMVRNEAHGTSLQSPFRRRLENVFLGDAKKRGELHRWMYDRVSLRVILERAGFSDVTVRSFNDSSIRNWESMRLEVNDDGSEYKTDSLYVEAVKRTESFDASARSRQH